MKNIKELYLNNLNLNITLTINKDETNSSIFDNDKQTYNFISVTNESVYFKHLIHFISIHINKI